MPASVAAARAVPILSMTAGERLTSLGIAVRYITDSTAAAEVISSLRNHGDPIGIDIETAKLPEYSGHPQAGLNPHLSRIRLVQLYCGGTEVFVLDILAVPVAILVPLLDKALIAHNAVFELQHLMHQGLEPRRIECTMLQANAIWNTRPKLSMLAEQELRWQISKEAQVSDWGAATLSQEQLDYAALDSVIVYKLFPALDRKIARKGRRRCYELMRNAQHAVARMQLNGVFFDRVRQREFISGWQSDRDVVRGELNSLFGTGLSFGSNQQLARWLERNLSPELLKKWPRGKSGALQTGKKVLALFPELPFVAALLKFKTLDKLITGFGEKYASHVNPVTGRIHATFQIAGTATGRMACWNPNVQNPPKGDFRQLFSAPPGRVLIVADYGQIELRVMALVAGEKTMLAAYSNGIDLHRKTAAALVGTTLDKVTKNQRQLAKAVNFGLLFGQGAPGLARYAKTQYGVDMSLEDANKYRRAFFKTYPGLRRWQTRTAGLAEASHSVKTPSGRLRTFKRKRGKSYFTQFLNTPVQGGAAEVMLAALAVLDRKLKGLDAKLVNVVHDEVVLDVAAQDTAVAKSALEEAMTEGMLAVFPRAYPRELVDAHSGLNWAEAKG